MATLERPREAAGLSSEQEASLFPDAPKHIPRIRTSSHNEEASSRTLPLQGAQVTALVEASRELIQPDEEEMEEVLEELQDDEIEVMADPTDFYSPDNSQQLIEQELATGTLLDTAQTSCLSMVASLEQGIVHTPASDGDDTEDARLLSSLRDLNEAIQAAKQKADVLDVRPMEGREALSPIASNSSSASPKDVPPSPFSSQSSSQRVYGLGRQNASSSPIVSSSPSKSREELRNPFSDPAARSHNVASEDRLRHRNDHDADSMSQMNKLLREVEKRCDEVTFSMKMTVSPSEAVAGMSQESKKRLLETWLNLQQVSRSIQKSVATRRSSPHYLDVRKGSHSPIACSPSYSPSRNRSRRNSTASQQSASTSLHSNEGGDPVGEATAAGVGMGVTRHFPGNSSTSVRTGSGSTIAFLPSSTSILMGSPHTRRESTKSESIAPPRYSDDSARKWSESVHDASREAESSTRQQRERQGSTGNMSDISARTLPAYNSNDMPYQKLSTSSSSLNKLDLHNMLPRDEKKRNLSTADSNAGMSQQPLQRATSAEEYSARTSQDLRMVESSIERLYSAVPQLDNQRASSPTEIKQRQSQDVLGLIDQLTKSGRMEDQRAVLPVETLQRNASVPASTAVSQTSDTAPQGTTKLGRRLGSISLGRSLSMRLVSSVLGSDGKGKEKERSSDAHDDQSAATLPSTNLNGLPSRKKPSKLNIMGVTVSATLELEKALQFADSCRQLQTKEAANHQDDGGFMDALAASMSGNRRMSGQDAPLRPLSARRLVSSPSSATFPSSPLYSKPSSPNRPRGAHTHAFTRLPSSPINRTSDGECAGPLISASDAKANSSNRGVCIDNDVIASKDIIKSGPLRYISESQPRLGIISTQFWHTSIGLDDASMNLDYFIDQEHPQVLNIVHNQATKSYILPSPGLVSQDRQTVLKSQDHWQIKLQMAATLQRDSNEVPAPLSASSLQKDLPSGFLCNVCLKSVAYTKTITQYLPLPSQHWEELIDAWMCHSSQEINQGMIDTQKKLDEHRGLHQDQGRVSDAGIVFHASHLADGATFKEDTSSVSSLP
jgi:hypothetical protein